MPIDDRWLGVDEITEHLGVGGDTVYPWINEKSQAKKGA